MTPFTKFRRAPTASWQEGDVAYLRPSELFTERETRELITTRLIDRYATGHPCVILKVLPDDRAVITTVSAYGSGAHNNNLVPWLAKKRRYGSQMTFFRSFEGSVCGSANFKPLQLIKGQTMPKPETSWLNINNVWAVPMSVLTSFTKSRYLLSMTPESLSDLRSDFVKRSPNYNPLWDFVPTPSSEKRGSTTTTMGRPRALPEAPVVTSCQRPTTTTNTTPAKIQSSHGIATPALRSQPTTTKAPAPSPTAAPQSFSWAKIASQAVVASKPKADTVPRQRMSLVQQTPWVKATA